MIPERNLIEGCGLKPNQQSKWISVITEMMNEGPRVTLRLEKIRKALIAYPEPLMWYSKMKTELEMLMLEWIVRQHLFLGENDVFLDTNNIVSGVENMLQTLYKCLVVSDSINEELFARSIEIVRTIALNSNVGNLVNCMFLEIIFRMLS
ncbi:hypothetical protein DPMN_125627 [Dreissena polymorpha]|uniref:Uncharacterized protein n=1 Tax=Dreissena polymorpha TaxID=45954 RepID=A0A9D4JT92_DREPO|nr:hypothetical protein DPMN_125627 [Dreissena polymorpha]